MGKHQPIQINKDWFIERLDEQDKSVRGLARHLGIDASAASRMLSGQRRMKMEEANAIARFLNAPVSEVLRHAGAAIEGNGSTPSRVLLAATIDEAGRVQRLKEPRPLPVAVIERAHAAIGEGGNGKVIAAQIRVTQPKGGLGMWDDAVVLFNHTEAVEPAAIGALSICRTRDGDQEMVRVIRARKTGEAIVLNADGKQVEALLDTATPILAVLP